MDHRIDAKLRVVCGAQPATIRLRLPATIGRCKEATLKVPHALVSRQHCEIYEEDGWLVVDDLDSSNGTFIDDQRISEPTFFYPGERLRVGTVVLEAIYAAPADAEERESADAEERESADAEERESADAGRGGTGDNAERENVAETGKSSAILHYEETDKGSFLGIAELEMGGEPSPVADSASHAAAFAIETDRPVTPGVEPGDSGFDRFLKGLE